MQSEEKTPQLSNEYLSNENPFLYLKSSEDQKYLSMKRQLEATQRIQPPFIPLGLEIGSVLYKREAIIEEVKKRAISKLQTELNEKIKSKKCVGEDIIDLQIEIKQLALATKQSILRERVYRGLQEVLTPDQLTTSLNVRTVEYNTLKDYRIMEALERNALEEQEKRRRIRKLEHLRSVAEIQKIILKKGSGEREALFKAAAIQAATYDRQYQKKNDKLLKERLKALRANDEQEYLRLLEKEKNTRVSFILNKTNEYLQALNVKIQEYSCNTALRNFHLINQPEGLTGGLLKDYQLRGVEWLISLYNNKLNGILADEMGLGKTVQTIGFITYLIDNNNFGYSLPFLVIVPLSTISNWAFEFKKWNPNLKVIEYKGLPERRKEIQQAMKSQHYHVVLTTYDYIIRDRNFLSRINWFYLIIDEGHRLKNHSSKLSTIMNSKYTSKHRLLLTGTPLQNNLQELWSLLNFVLPRIFHSLKSFEEWFSMPFGSEVEIGEEEQLLIITRLHKVLRPFLLRRLKSDVALELPEKVERIIKCRMSGVQRRLYNSVISEGKLKGKNPNEIRKDGVIPNNNKNIYNISNTVMQLRKICNHPFIFTEVERSINPLGLNNDLLYRTCGKFELLNRILPKLKAGNHKILIFFQMTQIMTIMEDFLVMQGYKYLRLDGNVKTEERCALIEKFNTEDYFIFLLSTRAGGLGLNLQAADTVIIYDSDWNPHVDLQAQDRAHRIGQTAEVRIFRLVTTDSIEEYILERAGHKLNLDGKVIQAGRFDQRSTQEERENILRELICVESKEICYSRDELDELLARNEDEKMLYSGIGGAENLMGEEEYDNYIIDNKKITVEDNNHTRDIAPTLDESQRDVMEFILNEIEDCEDEGRKRIDIFMTLPSRKHYPDYYQVIKNPISISCIKKKLDSYTSLGELLDDLFLMFDNAMAYNLEDSVVYKDAEYLSKLVKDIVEREGYL
ncbi:SWI/SNF chromatin-remodeling complex subunit snf22 [Astathelohania contejeani]|uniref:SWI/SNF chromatin-remodeling complex subunit snf22 n=1 Tax=Astathelohania contejeani TaxID=164912 RepID=A0ABQ7HZT4_9MICR|nr:SWI/SNF chromatin-remodeling complex subunit snf22 [Thelohania contejeani]